MCDQECSAPLLNESEVECESIPHLDERYRNNGWSIQYSKSQKKYYYFHANTGTSCWTFDDLSLRGEEVARDRDSRVARQNSSGETPSSSETTPSPRYPNGSCSERFNSSSGERTPNSIYPSGSRSERLKSNEFEFSRKRRLSTELSDRKKPRLSVTPDNPQVHWAFGIESECFVEVRHSHYNYFGINARMERYRSLFFLDLRKSLMQGIKNEFGLDLSQGSFVRWITEAKAFDSGLDPLLPTSIDDISKISSLRREILYEIPIRLTRPSSLQEAKQLVADYTRESERCIRKWCDEATANENIAEIRRIMKPFAGEETKLSFAEMMDILHMLINRLKPTIDKAAGSILDSICKKSLYEKSKQRVQWLHKDFATHVNNNELISAITSDNARNPQPTDEFPYLIMPDEPAKILGREEDFSLVKENAVIIPKGHSIIIKLDDSFHEIKSLYFEKLRDLYKLNCRDDADFIHFPTRLWALLNRYSTYLAANFADVNQAALPPSVFDCLNMEFGVTFELFASPFNCYFKQYCSAFPDTDCFFGSRGPLFNLYISQGSFQANPPFTEELLNEVVDFVTKRLEESNAALSIAFFVPDWRDPPVQALQKLEHSTFNRAQLTFPARQHGYRQDMPLVHNINSSVVARQGLIPSSRGTTLIFLQNALGYERWTPTPVRLKKIREAFYSSMT